MGSKCPVRVGPPGLDKGHHAGQFFGMFLYNGDLLRRSIFQNADRPVLYPAGPLECRIQRKGIKHPLSVLVHNMEQGVKHRIPTGLFPRQVQRLQGNLVRRPVTHQDLAVPVVNKTALGHQFHSAQAVVLRPLEIFVIVSMLQGIKPKQ